MFLVFFPVLGLCEPSLQPPQPLLVLLFSHWVMTVTGSLSYWFPRTCNCLPAPPHRQGCESLPHFFPKSTISTLVLLTLRSRLFSVQHYKIVNYMGNWRYHMKTLIANWLFLPELSFKKSPIAKLPNITTYLPLFPLCGINSVFYGYNHKCYHGKLEQELLDNL